VRVQVEESHFGQW